MNQVIRGLLFAGLIVLLAGCSSPYRPTEEGERLSGRYIGFETPGTEWEIAKDYETAISKHMGREPMLWRDQNIYIHRYVPGATLDIDIRYFSLKGDAGKDFFSKKAKYGKLLKDEDMVFSENDKEQGINYKRAWVAYAQGLKCQAHVFSRGHGGVMTSVANKNYGLNCAYYDKLEGKIALMIMYRYTYAAGSTRLQKDEDTPKSELLSQAEAEMMLKRAVKHVVDSIEIKNLDRKRMEREGLMHYDKQFEISPF